MRSRRNGDFWRTRIHAEPRVRLRPFLPATLMLVAAHGPLMAASLTFTPAKIEFGVQPVNSESQPATVTLENDAGQPIQLTEIIPSGIDFRATHDCKNELAPGAQCAIQIRFKPRTAGDRIGIIEIVASDSPSPHFVPLSGTGR